jgi:hypothetical protein
MDEKLIDVCGRHGDDKAAWLLVFAEVGCPSAMSFRTLSVYLMTRKKREMRIKVNGVELCAETFGDPADPPVLLMASPC